MKCKSDRKPLEFEIRQNGQNCLLVFSDNITESTVKDDETGEDVTEYSFDRYELEVPYRDTLEQDVESNLDIWLEKAKQNEIDKLSAEVRSKRNELLAESDSEFCIDRIFNDMKSISATALTEKLKELAESDIAKYRQSLRDIPEQEEFPYKVKWPSKPQ